MCYELLFKNRRNKRQVHALNMELKKKKIAEMRKKIVNIENRNATPTNLNIDDNKNTIYSNINDNPKLYIKKKEIENIKTDKDFLKKLEMEGPTHFNFSRQPYPNLKHVHKNNRHKVLIPKLTLDMKSSKIYKRRMKKFNTKSKSKSTIV